MSFEDGTLRTFASLRLKGDRLQPDRLTAVLGVAPSRAYRKGEVFKQSGGREARGRTGVWIVSSDGRVLEPNLDRHLGYLLALLFDGDCEEKLWRLRDVMGKDGLTADVSCFWCGQPKARPPVIPQEVRAAFGRLPAEIVIDFDTD